MILITGATGLVGSHLLYALLQHYDRIAALIRSGSDTSAVREIFSFYTKDPDPLLSRIEWRTGDLLDPASLNAALEGISCVINCAAIVSFDPRDKKLVVERNVRGVGNLVQALRDRGEDVRQKTLDIRQKTLDIRQKTEDVRPFHEAASNVFCLTSNVFLIHLSSISALGDSPGTSPKFLINEETPRDPKREHTAYSDSKYLSEKVILESGIPAVILNPGVILGPGHWNRGSSLFFTQVWEGMKYFPYGGTGYVDVRDVADVILRMMGCTGGPAGPSRSVGPTGPTDAVWPMGHTLRIVTGDRYCLVGANLRYRELFNLVTDEFGLPNPMVYASRTMTEFGWRAEAVRAFFTRKRPRLTREIAAASQRISFYSSDKIRQALGFEFRPVEETVEWVADCFKKTLDGRH